MTDTVRIVAADAQRVEQQVIELLEWMGLGQGISGELVIIKPNLVTDIEEYIEAGANTDLRLIDATLAYLADAGAVTKIAESDTGTALKGRRVDRVYALMGLGELARRYGAEAINLTETDWTTHEVAIGHKSVRIPLSTLTLEARAIVNLPKLKTHKYATMTCALKNLFGLVPDPMRILHHRFLDEVIAALAEIWWQRSYVVVDGLVGMEGDGPIYGRPVTMNLLLAGRNPLAVDQVAAQMMGIDPARVGHLRAAARRCGWTGSADPCGVPVEQVARRFEPAGRRWFVRFEGWLMRHPTLVRIIFDGRFRRFVSRPLHPILSRLRGGSYSWYTGRR